MLPAAMVDMSVQNAVVYDKFQFERNGYFSLDPDSKPGQVCTSSTFISFSFSERTLPSNRHHLLGSLGLLWIFVNKQCLATVRKILNRKTLKKINSNATFYTVLL